LQPRHSRLEKERKELMTAKSKLTKENEEKKARLEELEKQLDGFITVNFSLPVLPMSSQKLNGRMIDGKGDSKQAGELLAVAGDDTLELLGPDRVQGTHTHCCICIYSLADDDLA
jgi:hypothetical protein